MRDIENVRKGYKMILSSKSENNYDFKCNGSHAVT